jgi:hypothetical protein
MRRSLLLVPLTLLLTGLGATPAVGQAPPRPVVETETAELAGDPEAPFFVCGDEVVRFTGGTATFRFVQFGDRGVGIITLQDATASDGTTTYRVQGVGRISGTEDEGTFDLRLVLVGPAGQVETVNTQSEFSAEGGLTVDEGAPARPSLRRSRRRPGRGSRQTALEPHGRHGA